MWVAQAGNWDVNIGQISQQTERTSNDMDRD
jgi:hypothetical protein